MPGLNGTGPQGMGPGTGGRRGPCVRGLGWRRGYGRILGGWFGRSFRKMSKEEQRELLEAEIADIKEELKEAEEELTNLK